MNNQDELLILMAECISKLEYVADRAGADPAPFKKLNKLVKEIKTDLANQYSVDFAEK